MLRIMIFVVGWIYFISSVLGIFIRLFGSDTTLALVGLGRNIDVGIYMLIVSFFMLAFIKIVFELHDIKKKLYQIDIAFSNVLKQKKKSDFDTNARESVEQKRKPLVIEPKLIKD